MLTGLFGKKSNKLLIINRTFWPENDVLGAALLKTALKLSYKYRVYIQCISEKDVASEVKKKFGLNNLIFLVQNGSSSSKESISYRIIQNIIFSLKAIFSILSLRPKVVYISTDPPLMTPFFTVIVARLCGAKIVYHLQDIHPEAADLVFKINPAFKYLLRKIESISVRLSSNIIVLSSKMKDTLKFLTKGVEDKIIILNNCAPSAHMALEKKKGILFCGNLGRFQKVEYVLSEIDTYFKEGGTLPMTFIGGGVYTETISEASQNISNLHYLGKLSFLESSKILSKYQWAILSIDSEVLKYAYPSKLSSYLIHGCNIIFITDHRNDFADLIEETQQGIACTSKRGNLVEIFKSIENNQLKYVPIQGETLDNFMENNFVDKLSKILNYDQEII
jgi:hypothetical protein